ncbi:MAG: division plane positioning ATPase MipZ [Acidobacteriota bacterium]|nr:division plane positioning ATPase MipZ [Acidobacteriota bacterium]
MSNIIFTAGAKGGTGKSTAMRFLITYLREHKMNPLLLDLDDESRTLSRFFPDAMQVEIKKKSSHDILIESAIESDCLMLADLKAGTGREVLDWWLDVPFDELHKRDVSFICLASITSSPDSVQAFLNWVAALQDRVRYVVFKNLKDGEYLPDYEESDGALHFRQEFSPQHIVIPRLDEEYATELERLDLTIADVLTPGRKDIGPLLSKLMVRARLRRYQQNIYDQLGPIIDALGI